MKSFSKYSRAAFAPPDSTVGVQGWKDSVWGALLYPRAKHPTHTSVCSTGNTHRAPADKDERRNWNRQGALSPPHRGSQQALPRSLRASRAAQAAGLSRAVRAAPRAQPQHRGAPTAEPAAPGTPAPLTAAAAAAPQGPDRDGPGTGGAEHGSAARREGAGPGRGHRGRGLSRVFKGAGGSCSLRRAEGERGECGIWRDSLKLEEIP